MNNVHARRDYLYMKYVKCLLYICNTDLLNELNAKTPVYFVFHCFYVNFCYFLNVDALPYIYNMNKYNLFIYITNLCIIVL